MRGNEQPAAQKRRLVTFADAWYAILIELTMLHRVVLEVKAVVLAFVGGQVPPAPSARWPEAVWAIRGLPGRQVTSIR